MLLAQAKPSPMPVILWSGFLIAVTVVGGALILWLRGKMMGGTMKGGEAAAGLTGLRALRESGQMSQEEFDAAKASLAHRMTGKAPRRPVREPRPSGRAEPGALVAKPGFDLTGRPLPPAAKPSPGKRGDGAG